LAILFNLKAVEGCTDATAVFVPTKPGAASTATTAAITAGIFLSQFVQSAA
jgi:hypothetical protein